MRLRYFIRNDNGKLFLDSVACRDDETPTLASDCVPINPNDLVFIPPDLKELAAQSDEYWRRRHEEVGLPFPVRT